VKFSNTTQLSPIIRNPAKIFMASAFNPLTVETISFTLNNKLYDNQEYYTTTLELELQCISLSISVKENKVAASYTKYFVFPLFNIFCIYYGYSSFYDDL
jgi:hypothetical protein